MNRQQRRYAAKLRKKSTKEILSGLKKILPKTNLGEVNDKMTYEEFINSIEITPELLRELQEHEKHNNKLNNINSAYEPPFSDYEVVNQK